MFKISKIKFTVGLLLMVAMTAVIACGGTETVEVVKEVEVIKEVEVKGDTIVEKVVETVKGDTVTVEKEVLVVATATAQPAAPAAEAASGGDEKKEAKAEPPSEKQEEAAMEGLSSLFG